MTKPASSEARNKAAHQLIGKLRKTPISHIGSKIRLIDSGLTQLVGGVTKHRLEGFLNKGREHPLWVPRKPLEVLSCNTQYRISARILKLLEGFQGNASLDVPRSDPKRTAVLRNFDLDESFDEGVIDRHSGHFPTSEPDPPDQLERPFRSFTLYELMNAEQLLVDLDRLSTRRFIARSRSASSVVSSVMSSIFGPLPHKSH